MKPKKAVIRIGIILVAVIIFTLLGRNLLIKQVMQMGMKTALGMTTTIDEIKIGLFQSIIRVQGFTVYNPEAFKGETLARIPLIYVDYEFAPMLRRRIHCAKIELNLNEVTIVKNENGEVNLNKLKAIASGKEKAPEEIEKKEEKKKNKEREMKIDKLILTIDHVKFVDYSSGEKKERTISIGVDHEEFENFNSVEELVRVIVLKTVMTAGLHNIGIAVDRIAGNIKHIGGKGMEVLNKGAEVLKDVGGTVKSEVGKAGEVVKSGIGKAKEETEGLLEKLNIFGN